MILLLRELIASKFDTQSGDARKTQGFRGHYEPIGQDEGKEIPLLVKYLPRRV
jgi:hypothetical protein